MTSDRPHEPRAGEAADLEQDRFVGDTDLTRWHSRPGAALARAGQLMGTRLGDRAALAVILLAGCAVIALLAFGFDRIYDSVTERDGIAALDVPILRTAIHLRSAPLNTFCAVIAELFGGVGMPILATAAAIVFVALRRSWTPGILIAATGLGSIVLTTLGKDAIGRHRPALIYAVPPFESSPSLPSGHTTSTTAIVGIVVYLLILRQRTPLTRTITIAVGALIALTVGLTRVLLGAHWFTDVLAGWCVGAAWLAVVITAHRVYLTARKRREAARAMRTGAPQI